MADKRMFSSKIIDSDAFIDMSPMARLLYFNLSIHADDDGFTNSVRREMKIVGASDSDLDELISKRFVIRFDSGVVAIKHWRINNTIRSDRYKATTYTDEKSLLAIEPNGAYTRKSDNLSDGIPTDNQTDTSSIPTDNQCVPQISIVKNSIEEDRLEEDRLGEIKNSSEQKISSELVPPPNPDECIEFPVLGGSTYIPKSLIDEWESVYTNVDVMQEVLKAKEWCKANPKRLKVNWRSFLVNWLNKNQDRRPMHEEGYRTQGPNRCMEPDKVIEAEEAGF